MNNENQNKCSRCNKVKSINEFSINVKNNSLYKECNKCKEQQKEYVKENKDKIKRRDNKYRKENLDKIKEYHKEYKKVYFKDIKNRIRNNVNKRIGLVIKNKLPDYKIYLGCDIKEYITYLESKFKDGMSWDNYGKVWEIDHIRPLKPKVPISQEETIKRLHYTNTQPLYCIENMIKQNKEVIQEELCKNFENKLKVEEEQEYAEIIFIDEDEEYKDKVIQEIIDTYL